MVMSQRQLALINEFRDKMTGRFGEQPHTASDASDLPTVRAVQDVVREFEFDRTPARMPAEYERVRTTREVNRDAFWITAEQQGAAQAVSSAHIHVMPDDHTPGRTKGRSELGNRRTHRMRYSVGGVELRMPSRTSINRFQDDIQGAPFDVPVAVKLPNGQTQQVMVRVQRGHGGMWETSAVGIDRDRDPERYVQISEAVCATLEDRSVRPSRPVEMDLLARHRARHAGEGAVLNKPTYESSFVRGISYNQQTRQMVLQLGDRTYLYDDVPLGVAMGLAQSQSPGRFYNEQIKGKLRSHHDAVVVCDECGRFTLVGGVKHTCPYLFTERNSPEVKQSRMAVVEYTMARGHRA